MDLYYVVSTPQGGTVQKLTVKGKQGGFYTFSRPQNKGVEGTFVLSAPELTTLPRLSEGLKDYRCRPSTAADNQMIEITVQGVHIRCTEAGMDENRAVSQLIHAIRRLIASQLAR